MPVLSFFGGGGKPVLFRDGAHLRLLQLSQREQDVFQLFLRDLVEKIRLVLVGVRSFEQVMHVLLVQNVAVMPRGNVIRAQPDRIVLEGAELDLPVAQHVGIGRSARLVLAQEIGKDALGIFL